MTDYSRFEDDVIVNSYHAQSPSKLSLTVLILYILM